MLNYFKCTSCNIDKSEDSFWFAHTPKLRRFKQCIDCTKARRTKPKKEDNNRRAAKYRSDPENYKKMLERTKEWRKQNLEYDAFRAATYRATKNNQTPSWANLEKIKEIYMNCPQGYHVDHIIPLRGKIVNGFHVETNLQYLSAKDNLAKRNIYHA